MLFPSRKQNRQIRTKQEQAGKITVFKDMVFMCRETAGAVRYSGTCFHARHKGVKKETLWFIGSGAWPSRDDPAM